MFIGDSPKLLSDVVQSKKSEQEPTIVTTNSVYTAAATASEPKDVVKTEEPKQGVEPKQRKKRKQQSKKSANVSEDADDQRQSKRVRLQYQPFQSPQVMNTMPYFRMRTPSSSNTTSLDDKIMVFSKGEFLAVRNETGTFFICRTAQKVYKNSRKFKIRWLTNEKGDPNTYTLDFYDTTDFECVLTNLRLEKISKGNYSLPDDEKKRTLNILERALNVEKGVSVDPRQFAEDGVDVSFVGKAEEKELIKTAKSAAKSDASSDSDGSTIPDPPPKKVKVKKEKRVDKPKTKKLTTAKKNKIKEKFTKERSSRADKTPKVAKAKTEGLETKATPPPLQPPPKVSSAEKKSDSVNKKLKKKLDKKELKQQLKKASKEAKKEKTEKEKPTKKNKELKKASKDTSKKLKEAKKNKSKKSEKTSSKTSSESAPRRSTRSNATKSSPKSGSSKG